MRRDKHEGSITRMPNGRYRLRVMISGKIFSHTADSKVELNKWRRELLIQIESGIKPHATRMTVTEAFHEWFVDYAPTVRRSTSCNIASAIKMWERLMPGMKLTHLNKGILQHAVDVGLASGYSARTLSCRATILGMMCSWAVEKGYILRSPNDGIRLPATRTKVDRNVVDYAERIIEYFDEQHDELMAARCRLLVYTGLRISEACGLKWSDVDMDRQSISVSRQAYKGRISVPKTLSSYRTITLPNSAIGVLEYFQAQSKGPYIISTTDKPCSGNNVSKNISRAGKALGFEFKCHWFRHAHSSFCLHHGVNIAAISARLGHASISTTLNIYSHMLPGADDAVRELWAVKHVVKKVE